ncbi:MAG: heme-binding protein [Planctomycetota bacterium]
MLYGFLTIGLVAVGYLLATSLTRVGYESAEFSVVERDDRFEIRSYPDLWLAATSADLESQGRDGSFMRLFGYISGANENDQKIAMTTPVFMDAGVSRSGTMGFVVPKATVASGAPAPTSADVRLEKRKGGRFAAYRFSGRLTAETARSAESELRDWISRRGLVGDAEVEAAGYDPPFTPGPFRRNEVLIRLLPRKESAERGDGWETPR